MHVALVHEQDVRYKCDLCDKGFPYASMLERHKAFHTSVSFSSCMPHALSLLLLSLILSISLIEIKIFFPRTISTKEIHRYRVDWIQSSFNTTKRGIWVPFLWLLLQVFKFLFIATSFERCKSRWRCAIIQVAEKSPRSSLNCTY